MGSLGNNDFPPMIIGSVCMKEEIESLEIVDLDDVLSADRVAIDRLRLAFVAKGWCIVRLPRTAKCRSRSSRINGLEYGNLIPTQEEIQNLLKFFSQDREIKTKYCAPHSYGYSEVDHKEGIRILTGWRLPDFQPFIPPDLREPIVKYTELLDELTTDLVLATAKPLFGCTPSAVAGRADLPVAYKHCHHFGMLDIAHYYNKKFALDNPQVGFSVEEVNCVPHYDPGLLSLSFLSTLEGLQLQDPTTGAWFSGPVNTIGEPELGVIWLGEAAVKASKGGLKAGVHRVVYPQSPQSRLTMWYEVCTLEQVADVTEVYSADGQIQFNNLPGSKPVAVQEGELKSSVLQRVERTLGIPMRKIRRKEDNFKRFSNKDL